MLNLLPSPMPPPSPAKRAALASFAAHVSPGKAEFYAVSDHPLRPRAPDTRPTTHCSIFGIWYLVLWRRPVVNDVLCRGVVWCGVALFAGRMHAGLTKTRNFLFDLLCRASMTHDGVGCRGSAWIS